MKMVPKKHEYDASSSSYYPAWSNEEFNEGPGEKNGAVSQNLYTPFPALNSARIKGGHLRRSTDPRSAEECGTCEAVYRKSTESMERI